MFDSLSPTTQLVLTIIGIALLFLLVTANNRRNKNKNSSRRRRSFREGIEEKKKEQ